MENLRNMNPIKIDKTTIINLEKGLLVGAFFVIAGLGLSFYGLKIWSKQNYGAMELRHTLRIIIPAVTTIVIGIQIILFSFFFKFLKNRV